MKPNKQRLLHTLTKQKIIFKNNMANNTETLDETTTIINESGTGTAVVTDTETVPTAEPKEPKMYSIETRITDMENTLQQDWNTNEPTIIEGQQIPPHQPAPGNEDPDEMPNNGPEDEPDDTESGDDETTDEGPDNFIEFKPKESEDITIVWTKENPKPEPGVDWLLVIFIIVICIAIGIGIYYFTIRNKKVE